MPGALVAAIVNLQPGLTTHSERLTNSTSNVDIKLSRSEGDIRARGLLLNVSSSSIVNRRVVILPVQSHPDKGFGAGFPSQSWTTLPPSTRPEERRVGKEWV